VKVLITGATRGIGRAIANEFAEKAYDLVIVSRNEKDLLEAAGDLIEIGANNVEYIVADLTKPSEKAELLESLDTPIDVLINNMGAYDVTSTEELSSGILHSQFSANLYPAIDITNHVLKGMKEKGTGNIIFIGSVAADNLIEEASAYSIAKLALSAYADLLRKKMKGSNIKIAEIIPGAVNTSSWDGIDAPTHEFIPTRDIVEVMKIILSTSKQVQIDKIYLNPVKH
jgi:short-subunit dehydrogenase